MGRLSAVLGFTLSLVLCLVAIPASAEEVIEAWRSPFGAPCSVSVNTADGSCWAAGDSVLHVAADGTVLGEYGGFSGPSSVSVNATDGSCWVADKGHVQVVHLSAAGAELWRGGDFWVPYSVSVNTADGSCWVADIDGSQVVQLSATGAELWRTGAFVPWPHAVSVNPTDGSCWVALVRLDLSQVVHFSGAGTELWRSPSGAFFLPWGVSVNPADGSCWVADSGHDQVVHLSAAGAELWRGSGFESPESVSVNATDGSCWVADIATDEVIHLAEDGAELWRGGGFDNPCSVSVNSADGSCWVAECGDYDSGQVAHLVIWFHDVPPDHWARQEIEACFFADIVGGYPGNLYCPESPVTRDQMAVYVSRAVAGGDEYVPEFTDMPSFPDVGGEHWALDYVEYAVDQNVVAGYEDGLYHPEYQVTRDQMAVYVAHALVAPTGEAALADYVPADPRNFPDVPTDHWAYTHIEYCVENGVVSGYLDGNYHPEGIVTRDQMAVYVARAFGLAT